MTNKKAISKEMVKKLLISQTLMKYEYAIFLTKEKRKELVEDLWNIAKPK